MTPSDLKAKGYEPLSEFLDIPEDNEILEAMIHQLEHGKHDIAHQVYRSDPGTAQLWAVPVAQTYEDKL
jgi:hypothetical protein